MKICKTCNENKELSEYYKHKQMRDGHLNKCKDCTKIRVFNHRGRNLDKIRAYDRDRGARQAPEYQREYRAKYPNKYKAHTMVNNAIRVGKLFRESCSECGSTNNTHAHHDDYLKPLNIRWLCCICHSKWHKENGEALNP